MAVAVKGFKGSKLLVKIAHPDTPTAFVHYCTINAERGIEFTAAFLEELEEFCDDEELVAWLSREKESVSASINGGGKINTPDIEFFFEYLISPDSYPCEVIVDVPAADGGVKFVGNFHLQTFGISADSKKAKGSGAVAFLSDGEVTLEPNDA